MSEWFVYQPSGQHVGPLTGASLARGVMEGKISRDAHVARAGSPSWQIVTTVHDVMHAIATREPPTVPSPPAIPVAPPPRTTLPPAAQHQTYPRPEIAQAGIANTMPSNRQPRGAAANEPPRQASMVLPIVLFAVCFVLSVLVAIIGLVMTSKTHVAPHVLGWTTFTFGLGGIALLLIRPQHAAVRVVVTAVLLFAGAYSELACVSLPNVVNVFLSVLILRFVGDGRDNAAHVTYDVAWGLVPGLTVLVWTAGGFGVFE